MLRNVLGVIAGYLIAGLTVAGLLTVSYLGLGADRAFKPGIFEASNLWLVVWLVVTLGGGVAGGYVSALIGSSRTAPRVLAGLIFALGILSAAFTPPQTGVLNRRGDAVGLQEAMTKAEPPSWVGLANPVLGVLGVFIGAGLVQRRRTAAPAPVIEESTVPDTD